MSLATKFAKLTRFTHKTVDRKATNSGTTKPASSTHGTAAETASKNVVSKHKSLATKHWPVTEIARAGNYEITFECRSDLEVMRAQTLATKEVGTIDWILSDLKPGQIFLDVGANIGVYSLFAGKHLNGSGRVYSFEPHAVNVSGLLANAQANHLAERLQIFSCALNDCDGFFEFEYSSLKPGAAFNSLLGNSKDIPTATKKHCSSIKEFKAAYSVDSLIERGVILPPDHIKIDVDGIELRIVHGMRKLLSSHRPPASLQIELDPETAQEITSLMANFGYSHTFRHDTLSGKKSLANGAEPASIAHNVVFRRSGEA